MNEEFFKPRGLYCLIMTYKPDSTASHTRVDINQTISNYSNPASSAARQTLRNLRTSSGKTYGELELPESAPLIFPGLDKLAEDSNEAAKNKGKMTSRSGKFVADYFDRRAQAKWTHENPNSKLAVPIARPEYASRFSDPNHPANNGSIISLLTGGKVNPWAHKEEKRLRRRQRRAARRGLPVEMVTGERRKRKNGIVKRILTKVSSPISCLRSQADRDVGCFVFDDCEFTCGGGLAGWQRSRRQRGEVVTLPSDLHPIYRLYTCSSSVT